jgi:ABC-type transport system involved in multi-copper enzyme maturation permease subunit
VILPLSRYSFFIYDTYPSSIATYSSSIAIHSIAVITLVTHSIAVITLISHSSSAAAHSISVITLIIIICFICCHSLIYVITLITDCYSFDAYITLNTIQYCSEKGRWVNLFMDCGDMLPFVGMKEHNIADPGHSF